MLNRILFISAFILFACNSISAQDSGNEAMFGLKWNTNLSDVKSLGITLNKASADKNFEIYTTNSLPKNISDIETYSLIFSEGKLVKITAVSKNITDDIYGTTGKERFDTLKNTLVEKYGKPTVNRQSVGNKLYDETDEFYQCLAYKGCGLWVTALENSTKNIALELQGIRRGTGYIKITVESVPFFSDALTKYKNFKSKSDKDAL